MRSVYGLLLVVVALCAAAFADTLGDANAAFQANDFARSATLFQQVVREQPENGLAWYRLGRSLQELKRFDEAREPLEKAFTLKFQPGFASVNLAAGYVALNQPEKAAEWLRQAATIGVPAAAIEQDRRFDPVRNDAGYLAALRQIHLASTPCKFPKENPEYRQLDFWVGHWDVFNRLQQQAGTSDVDLIVGDCVVYENWSGAFGGSGKSFNKYNPQEKRWEQYWVAENGTTTFYTGQLEKGSLVYHSEQRNPDGSHSQLRLTFTPLDGGKVRQFGEISTDDGKTWKPQYDLTYVKRKAS